MSKQAGFAKDQLKVFVDRITNLENEKEALGDDIKEVYNEAKGSGFDTKTLRKIVGLNRLERSSIMEADAMEDLYRRGIGLPPLKD